MRRGSSAYWVNAFCQNSLLACCKSGSDWQALNGLDQMHLLARPLAKELEPLMDEILGRNMPPCSFVLSVSAFSFNSLGFYAAK